MSAASTLLEHAKANRWRELLNGVNELLATSLPALTVAQRLSLEHNRVLLEAILQRENEDLQQRNDSQIDALISKLEQLIKYHGVSEPASSIPLSFFNGSDPDINSSLQIPSSPRRPTASSYLKKSQTSSPTKLSVPSLNSIPASPSKSLSTFSPPTDSDSLSSSSSSETASSPHLQQEMQLMDVLLINLSHLFIIRGHYQRAIQILEFLLSSRLDQSHSPSMKPIVTIHGCVQLLECYSSQFRNADSGFKVLASFQKAINALRSSSLSSLSASEEGLDSLLPTIQLNSASFFSSLPSSKSSSISSFTSDDLQYLHEIYQNRVKSWGFSSFSELESPMESPSTTEIQIPDQLLTDFLNLVSNFSSSPTSLDSKFPAIFDANRRILCEISSRKNPVSAAFEMMQTLSSAQNPSSSNNILCFFSNNYADLSAFSIAWNNLGCIFAAANKSALASQCFQLASSAKSPTISSSSLSSLPSFSPEVAIHSDQTRYNHALALFMGQRYLEAFCEFRSITSPSYSTSSSLFLYHPLAWLRLGECAIVLSQNNESVAPSSTISSFDEDDFNNPVKLMEYAERCFKTALALLSNRNADWASLLSSNFSKSHSHIRHHTSCLLQLAFLQLHFHRPDSALYYSQQVLEFEASQISSQSRFRACCYAAEAHCMLKRPQAAALHLCAAYRELCDDHDYDHCGSNHSQSSHPHQQSNGNIEFSHRASQIESKNKLRCMNSLFSSLVASTSSSEPASANNSDFVSNDTLSHIDFGQLTHDIVHLRQSNQHSNPLDFLGLMLNVACIFLATGCFQECFQIASSVESSIADSIDDTIFHPSPSSSVSSTSSDLILTARKLMRYSECRLRLSSSK